MLLGLTFVALLAAAAAESSSEEAEFSRHASLNDMHAKLAALDRKMAAKFASEDPDRKALLQQRLQEIAADGYKPTKQADVSFEGVNEHSRLFGDFYEGDVLLTQEQLDHLDVVDPRNASSLSRVLRQAWKPARFPSNIWGNEKPIPFSIDPNYPSDKVYVLREGIKFWEDNTCIRFREGAAGSERVKFIHGGGCYSYIGKIGGEQPVSIGFGCEFQGTVTHELGHTIGLYHQQSRLDRDRYVIVNADNIENGTAINFDMGPQGEIDNFGTPYDYGSNMHYHPYAFTNKDGEPTLVATDKAYQYSMYGLMPSFYDVLLVNKYYNCFEAKCKGVSVNCQNGGVQNVNNCRACTCPTGYGGNDCSATDSKFKKLQASASPKAEELKVGNGVGRMADHTTEDFYVIEAPQGKRVELTISEVNNRVNTIDCLYGGMQIWTKKDTRMSGFKVCAKEQAEKYYLSEGEKIFIKIWNRYGTSTFNFSHRSG